MNVDSITQLRTHIIASAKDGHSGPYRKSLRPPTLARLAEFINSGTENHGHTATVEKSYSNTDRKIGRLRSPGKGRKGYELKVFRGQECVFRHDSSETYRMNYEVCRWIDQNLIEGGQ